jgi:hypothetical protein
MATIEELDDVLWQRNDGLVFAGQPSMASNLGTLPPNTIEGIGDFNADDFDDILVRQGVDVTVYEVQDGNLIPHVQPDVPTTWQIAGTGDFDGDNDDDILWRHDEGAVTIWEMDDSDFVINHNQPFASTDFEVAGVGNFDGDADDDILWRGEDGQVVIWEMQDGEYVTNLNQPTVSTSFEIAGTGDFDGDADDDILWRGDEGQVVIWEMQDGAYVVNHNQPDLSTNLFVEGIHDFDGDGDDDILWSTDTNAPPNGAADSIVAQNLVAGDLDVMVWHMEDFNVDTIQTDEISSNFRIVGVGEFDTIA